ncbi:MAG: MoxR family ATPase [Thermotogota bacterium]|nr:MoxR family ATPase [Thermotogota bacterium]
MKPSTVKYLSKKIMASGEIPLLWGHFGVGKTDIAKEIAEETGRELIILIISQMEPGDLIGLPSRDTEKTVFLRPDWWPNKDEVIIMIDEINRAHRSIRNAIMQLLIDRRIHNHILPAGAWIMGAANPPDEEYDQVDLITDPAFMSRFFHLELSPDVEDWINWSNQEQVKGEVISFIKEYPEYLSSDNIVSMRLNLRPSPRSWYKLSNVLSNLSEDDMKKYGYVIAASIVGSEAARGFLSHLENKVELPNPKDLLIEGKNLERIEKLTNEEKVSLILRINNYFESLKEEEIEQLLSDGNQKTIAENIKHISEFVPKDAMFSVLRFLNEMVEKNKGLKKAFYDKLLEEIAIKLGDSTWMEGI